MTKVSAFVAHSFREKDEEHVRKFLGFYDHLADTNSDFSWDHALAAEPKDLRQKVFEKIEGKNLLIAICSRHSYAIDPSSLKSSIFGKRSVSSNGDLVWMTSEWVIQEIGLALGRGMDLILLIESGVRRPGGLQGNIEYVEFSRDAPERAFIRVMEMVNALVGKEHSTQHSAIASAHESTSVAEPAETKASLASHPTAEMTLEELDNGRFMAMIERDLPLLSEYTSAFLASQWGASILERARWSAREQWLKQLIDGDGSFSVIRASRVEWPNDPVIASTEGRYLENMSEYANAARCYLIAAQHETDTKKRIKNYTFAAKALSSAKDWSEVKRVLGDARALLETSGQNEDLEHNFLEDFSKVYEDRDQITKIASFERLLETKPDDRSIRFDLAYLYGELKMHDLAFYHYDRVSFAARSDAVWNNLGVAAGNLAIKGVSVDAYQHAIEKGNTLAASNQARLQRDSGFLKEAEASCRAALQKEGCDPQAGETLSSIAQQRSEEENKVAELRKGAEEVSRFMRLAGSACASVEFPGLSGEWLSPQCVVSLSENESAFTLNGFYEREKLNIFKIADGGKENEKITLLFSGTRYGNAVFGKVVKTVSGSLHSVLGGGGDENPFYMYYDKDRDVLKVLELGSAADKKYYEITRVVT